ncbi:hypothetical protein NERG_01065, partial [Nematocida ausubeli]
VCTALFSAFPSSWPVCASTSSIPISASSSCAIPRSAKCCTMPAGRPKPLFLSLPLATSVLFSLLLSAACISIFAKIFRSASIAVPSLPIQCRRIRKKREEKRKRDVRS